MANPEHLELLKKGVGAWNEWRDHHRDISLDLSGTDLRWANLRLADLHGTNLSESDLRQADLFNAHLSLANLFRANLSRAHLQGASLLRAILNNADLRHAELYGTDFTEADLSGANLTQAVLGGTTFNSTTLRGTDITGAELWSAVFAAVDLREVIGLEKVRHIGPSRVGIETVYRSSGKIPEVFLRGAGVPDNFIQYMHSLAGAAFDFYSCFISYSSKDQEFADRLYADLQVRGVRCWLATEGLKIGDKFRQRIDDAIRLHDKLLVVLSDTSVASMWVESEVETALEREHREGKLILFPIRLDDAVMRASAAWAGEIRRQRHMGNFSAWEDHDSYQNAFARLLRDLKGEHGQEVKAKAAKE